MPGRIATCMFRDELDMLDMRLAELDGKVDLWCIVETTQTHRGVPKPLVFHENRDRYRAYEDRIIHVVADTGGITGPWAREHAQRNAMWPALLDAGVDDQDIAYITDVDELPSDEALAWEGPDAVALWMRTTLYAVDWEVPSSYPLPPTAVAATVGWLKEYGGRLAEVRDARGSFPVIRDGGWHFSWTGGPETQRRKLLTGTCHTELLDHPESRLILSGERYRDGADGGGIPVVPVDVDESWPAWIRERRCPPDWFRPRGEQVSA